VQANGVELVTVRVTVVRLPVVTVGAMVSAVVVVLEVMDNVVWVVVFG